MSRPPPFLRLLALFAVLLPARAEADEAKFWLRITGSIFVNFEGDCQLVDQRGFATTTRIIGSVPQTFAITAEAVDCQIQNSGVDGTLIAELGQNKVLVARASTGSSFGEVKVRSEGPWGDARATVSVPIVPNHRHFLPSMEQPGLPSPIVPPLSGQSVPPLH